MIDKHQFLNKVAEINNIIEHMNRVEESARNMSDLDLLAAVTDRVRAIAFEMPAPNADTSKLLSLVIWTLNEVTRRRALKERE